MSMDTLEETMYRDAPGIRTGFEQGRNHVLASFWMAQLTCHMQRSIPLNAVLYCSPSKQQSRSAVIQAPTLHSEHFAVTSRRTNSLRLSLRAQEASLAFLEPGRWQHNARQCYDRAVQAVSCCFKIVEDDKTVCRQHALAQSVLVVDIKRAGLAEDLLKQRRVVFTGRVQHALVCRRGVSLARAALRSFLRDRYILCEAPSVDMVVLCVDNGSPRRYGGTQSQYSRGWCPSVSCHDV